MSDGVLRAGRHCDRIQSRQTEQTPPEDTCGSRLGLGEVACASSSSRARISPPGSDGARKTRSYRSGAAGAALSPGPAGLDRRPASVHDVSRGLDALTYHTWRAHAARLAAQSVPNEALARRWPAVMTPRDGGLRAAELVASHRAADGAGPSIEGARTYAGGISRGAVVRFRAFRTSMGYPSSWLDRPRPFRSTFISTFVCVDYRDQKFSARGITLPRIVRNRRESNRAVNDSNPTERDLFFSSFSFAGSVPRGADLAVGRVLFWGGFWGAAVGTRALATRSARAERAGCRRASVSWKRNNITSC